MSSGYGSGQRMPGQSTYEAPACVQNAMNRDKKPFTYTPGGIDLSQIKSERMAKRLARNACIEGAAGQSQHNRPTQPLPSPGSPGSAAAAMGAAAMGMPFQVLPSTPHPTAGKNQNGGSAPAPPPPPSSSNFLNTGNPQMNGVNGGRGSAPNSPNMPRKAPAGPPQRFEPPPLGFRPEIKIPVNPMAALRKVPPPVEKNTFWKDEYKKNKGVDDNAASTTANNSYNTEENDSVNGSSSSTPQTNASNGTEYPKTNGETNDKSDNIDITDGFKKTMPTTTTNRMQQNQTTNITNTQEQEEAIKTPPKSSSPPTSAEADKSKSLSQSQSPREASQDTQSITSISSRPTPPTSPFQQQQFTGKPTKPVERESATPPVVTSPPKPVTPPQTIQIQAETQQKQQSPKPEFRSVAAAPVQPAVNVCTRQTDSPRSVENATPPRASESPFKYAQQQQRAPVTMSPLAQQTTPSSASSAASISPNPPQAQTVPWRTQRGQTPQKQQPVASASAAQSYPQPFYNNVQQQQQQQQQQQTPRAPDFSTQASPYQGPKPTNVGSLYIAPLAQPTEPQAQHIVRQQQLQQQQQQQQPQRDSPMRQMGGTQPNAQANLRWMSAQPKQEEQPAWVRPEENSNVVPSSLNRLKSPPPPPPAPTSFASQQQPMYQPLSMNPGNGFMTIPSAPHNFGAQPIAPTGLRLQINTQSIQNQNQTGPRERIIPIQLEQTPTYTPSSQPGFNTPSAYGAGSVSPAPGYVMRTPNQFVDQGYNNFASQQPQQRVMSPPMQQQQLNAPRMVQQQQQQSTGSGNTRTHIIPIAMDNSEGTRGPISKTPIVIQNDLRTPPVQSKSFRILQKITDTIDDGSNDDSGNNQQRNDNYMDAEPQLQRPTFARQMSAQQARNSPTVEQMRRMKIGHEQGNSLPQTPSQFNQQPRPFYNNNNNDYVPPSEQHVPEPKKYTGSAIPSRSFKILQAMTQPENAGEHDNSHDESNDETNNEIKSEHNNESCASSSSTEPASSTSMSSLNSDSICSAPTPPPPAAPPIPFASASSQPITYPQYPYPYGYPWYPPPCQPMPTQSNGDNTNTTNWHYPYAMPAPPPPPPTSTNSEIANPPNWPYPYAMPPPQTSTSPAGDNIPTQPYAPYPYYYPYPYAMPPFPPQTSQSSEFAPYLPPPPPYHAYPYPVAPSYSQTSDSSVASSALPDIIITPSTDDVPSKMIMQHHIKVKREEPVKRSGSIDIQDVSTTMKTSQIPAPADGSIVDILTHHLQNLEQNMTQTMENNLNSSSRSTKKSYKKNFDQKSPDDNTSPVQITMVMTESEQDSDTESSDSDVTTKQYDTPLGVDGKVPPPLQSIRSVSNVQFYNGHNIQNNKQEKSEDDDDDDDDSTTADGESDIFDEEENEGTISGDFEYERRVEHPDSECEEFYVEDNLSVIYEEESDFEKPSELTKTFKGRSLNLPDDLEKCIEENDEEEEEETDHLVSVSLPLKFSFTKSSNDESITTVEVGKSLVEDRRNSLTLSDKRNSFSVATINDSDSDDDGDSDSCDVSVTISLSPSSRSGSVDSKDGLRNMADKYPIEDMPLPEHTLPDIASSEEDVSFSLTLNKRNKFVGQTLQGGITNNIAHIEDEIKPTSKNMGMSKLKQSTEELDFFATLMATKMQAQKIKDETANYWGKSVESKDDKEETQKTAETPETVPATKDLENVKEIKCNNLDDSSSFWSDFSTMKSTDCNELDIQPCTKSEAEQETTQPIEEINDTKSYWDTYFAAQKQTNKPEAVAEEPEEIEDIWANRDDDFGTHKKSQSNYWDRYPKSSEVSTESEVKPHLITQNNEEEIEDIWATQNKEDTPVRSFKSYNGSSEFQQVPETKTNREADEVIQISTVDKEQKNLLKKVNPLETAKNSFWSTVAETNKPAENILEDNTAYTTDIDKPKCQLTPETIRELNYSPPVLRQRIEELSRCLTPLIHFEWEPTEKTVDETAEGQEEELDFWNELEEASQSPETQSETLADTKTYHSLFGQEEQKSSFWNNTEEVEGNQEYVSNTYNPLNYPEEPREVDTDEEIDFWAEIEAKGPPDDDEDVTFHRAATFWASQDRKNSVDETPYKPVSTKPFPAKLPDEPGTQDLNVWAALEAHKGEEPVLIDPQVEEEKELAQEFDEMSKEKEANVDHNSSMFDIASVHEAVVASVWNPPQKEEVHTPQATEEEIDFWSEIEKDKSDPLENEATELGNDDLETKRNNYRKAMAFFTTSIDDHKVESIESVPEAPAAINGQLNSQADEEEKWDWEGVKEAVKEQPREEMLKPEEEKRAKKPPKKERYPKNSLKSKSPPKANILEVCKTGLEVSDLPDVYVEPTLNLRRLSNGLPDLELSEERKVSVRDRISVFETGSLDAPDSRRSSIHNQSLSADRSSVTRQSSLSRNSSAQRSESEMEEDDSGVTDMNKLSETETESDSFPELKKMTSYQRAATHSRLFKLLQDDDTEGLDESRDDNANMDEHKLRPSRKKVVHNVSITRKQNPNVTADVETLTQRRERLSLPLRKNASIDADNPSTPNSPASPIMDQSATNQSVVSDKLVSELVQSLLLKSDSTHLRKLPMEKLQAAAKRVLEEELDSLENTSVDSTPSMTPNEAKKDKSYADYYNTWSDANGAGEIVPSKSFKALQDSRRSPWTARCPRVLSSKTINSDLTRVSESPETSMRSSKSQSRENSVSRWRKV